MLPSPPAPAARVAPRRAAFVRFLAAVVVLACLAFVPAPAAASDLVLATGPAGSEADAVGRALAAALNGHARLAGVRAVAADGPLDGLRRLADGSADLALVPSDLLADACEGRGEFSAPRPELRALAVLSCQTIHVIARPDLSRPVPPGTTGLALLRGRRVALGVADGGCGAATVVRLLAAHGLGPADLEVERAGEAEAVARFTSGAVDAVILAEGVPSRSAAAALAAGGVHLPIDAAATDPLLQRFPYLAAGRIDPAAYGGAVGAGGVAVPALEVDLTLACAGRVADGVAEDLVETLFALAGPLRAARPSLAALTPARTSERAPVPLQPGAAAVLEKSHATAYPVRVFVGVYAYSISELDIAKGTFLFDGYIWFRWQGRLFEDTGGAFDFALVNGTIESIDPGSRVIHQEGWHRQSRRLTARLRANFLLHEYPFDSQVLPLLVEHRWQGEEKLVFVPDDAAAPGGDLGAAFLAEGVRIGDWVVRSVRHEAATKQYETDFGSIHKQEWQGRSSRYAFTIEIRRTVLRYAVKLLLPLLVAVAMGFIVFWIHPAEFEAKSCLAILAILNCIGLQIAQAEHLPDVGYLVKADLFFILSYVLLSLCLVQVVRENALHRAGREDAVRRLMRFSRWAFPVGFAAPILWVFATS
ncbi:MAG: TAXI family TRAP transporter solute-binding subunit [Planctomycetes bacterium]|nr:TAXI family TRAP transporter solute-binding subunit [Planctomycetota bacterium]